MSWEVSPCFPMELLWLLLYPNLHSVIERSDGCTWVVSSKKLIQNHSAYPLLNFLNPLFLEEKQLFRVMRESVLIEGCTIICPESALLHCTKLTYFLYICS